MEDYKQKYEQALESAKRCYKDLSNLDGVVATMSKDFFEEIFPELKENDDEVMKEKLREILRLCYVGDNCSICTSDYEKLLAWLENQGEQLNSYSGVSFKYNGHIWAMYANYNGVDISLDNQFLKHFEMLVEQKPTDNLEVNEVDLDEEITDYINRHYHIRFDETLERGNDPLTTIDFEEIAKYFFELGLKVQKGE